MVDEDFLIDYIVVMLTNYRSIIFDFDGVLVDSVKIKTNAFYELYLEFGKEIAEKVVKHHNANQGMSRYEKFNIYHRRFWGKSLNESQLNAFSDRFSDICLKSIIDSKEIKGAEWFLNKYHNKKQFWIVSATPSEELRKIVKLRKLEKYFKAVFGSPEKKDSIVMKIIESESLNRSETLFIGDALADYEAAKSNAISFCLMESDENQNMFDKLDPIYRVRNFFGLEIID